jgi:hypothetical protein
VADHPAPAPGLVHRAPLGFCCRRATVPVAAQADVGDMSPRRVEELVRSPGQHLVPMLELDWVVEVIISRPLDADLSAEG